MRSTASRSEATFDVISDLHSLLCTDDRYAEADPEIHSTRELWLSHKGYPLRVIVTVMRAPAVTAGDAG